MRGYMIIKILLQGAIFSPYHDVGRMQGYLTNKKEEKINELSFIFLRSKKRVAGIQISRRCMEGVYSMYDESSDKFS